MKLDLATVKAAFPETILVRGRPCLAGCFVDRILEGIALSFTRRRYSACTYTWVEAWIGGQWVSLGDPWPCLTPSTKSLNAELARLAPQVAFWKLATGGQ